MLRRIVVRRVYSTTPGVRWRSREVSGLYPEERELRWLVSGVPPSHPSYRAAAEAG